MKSVYTAYKVKNGLAPPLITDLLLLPILSIASKNLISPY